MTEDDTVQPIEIQTVDLIHELRWKARRAFRMAEILRECDRDSAAWWVQEAFRLTNHADEIVFLTRKYLELREQAEYLARVVASPIEYVNGILGK